MSNTLYVKFSDNADAEKAAGALLDHGARKEDLSVIAYSQEPDEEQLDAYQTNALGAQGYARRPQTLQAVNSGYGTTVIAEPYTELDEDDDDIEMDNRNSDHVAKSGITTTTPADAGEGAAKGAGIGLGLGVLAGIASMFVPGIGLVYGAGALATAIAAAAATTAAGAVVGGAAGYLIDQGVPEEVVHEYSRTWETGGAIVSLSVPSGSVDELEARELVSKYGAISVEVY